MDINECFPSKYVGHTDLQGQDVTVIAHLVVLEDINSDDAERKGRTQKPVLYFVGMTKGLILNKTNASRIADLYGPETAHWIGQPITLYSAETEYGGKSVKCVRVREATQNNWVHPTPPPPPPNETTTRGDPPPAVPAPAGTAVVLEPAGVSF